MFAVTFQKKLLKYASRTFLEEVDEFLNPEWYRGSGIRADLDKSDPDIQTLIYARSLGRNIERGERIEAIEALRSSRKRYDEALAQDAEDLRKAFKANEEGWSAAFDYLRHQRRAIFRNKSVKVRG